MKTRILILECGKGFGGALTSLKTFLDEVEDQSGLEIHLITNYDQDLIVKTSSLISTKVIKRHRLYGPESGFEKRMGRYLPKIAGHLAWLADCLTSGWIYGLRIFWYMQINHIDILHLNNSILINDFGIIAGWVARKRVIVQVRAPEYPSKIAKALSHLVPMFLPVSNFVKSSLTALGIESSRITVVPEGIDAELFTRQAKIPWVSNMGDGHQCLVLGMVGCLVPWKGHGVFLEACALVLKQFRVMIYIVGDSPDKDPLYRKQLETQACELGIGSHVCFTGYCSNVAAVMEQCDILVHASTEPEPFGRVVLEAMSLGKAVVATRGGGPSEVIVHGVDGILVTPGDSRSMAQEILTLISQDHYRKTLGRAGKQKVSTQYTAQAHVELVLKAYKRLENQP